MKTFHQICVLYPGHSPFICVTFHNCSKIVWFSLSITHLNTHSSLYIYLHGDLIIIKNTKSKAVIMNYLMRWSTLSGILNILILRVFQILFVNQLMWLPTIFNSNILVWIFVKVITVLLLSLLWAPWCSIVCGQVSECVRYRSGFHHDGSSVLCPSWLYHLPDQWEDQQGEEVTVYLWSGLHPLLVYFLPLGSGNITLKFL